MTSNENLFHIKRLKLAQALYGPMHTIKNQFGASTASGHTVSGQLQQRKTVGSPHPAVSIWTHPNQDQLPLLTCLAVRVTEGQTAVQSLSAVILELCKTPLGNHPVSVCLSFLIREARGVTVCTL